MAHYYSEKQDTPLNAFKISVRARGITMELWSGSGVFSLKKLDNGTALLLEKSQIVDGSRVHDLGCGIGVVGCIIKRAYPGCDVVCSDVSERAVKLTKMNARMHMLKIEALQSDGYEKINGSFDTVLFNPPYVAGRETILRLIDEAYEHLKSGGLLQLVARHQKGGKVLRSYLQEKFGNVDDTYKQGGFRLYIACK